MTSNTTLAPLIDSDVVEMLGTLAASEDVTSHGRLVAECLSRSSVELAHMNAGHPTVFDEMRRAVNEFVGHAETLTEWAHEAQRRLAAT